MVFEPHDFARSQSHYLLADANGGVPEVVNDMLVFSLPGRLDLLPALPKAWPQGTIRGILARGQITIHQLTWDGAAKKVHVELTSKIDQVVTVRLPAAETIRVEGSPRRRRFRKTSCPQCAAVSTLRRPQASAGNRVLGVVKEINFIAVTLFCRGGVYNILHAMFVPSVRVWRLSVRCKMAEIIEGKWEDLVAREDLRGRDVRVVVFNEGEKAEEDPWLKALHDWVDSHDPSGTGWTTVARAFTAGPLMILVDTNILLRLAQPEDPHRQPRGTRSALLTVPRRRVFRDCPAEPLRNVRCVQPANQARTVSG